MSNAVEAELKFVIDADGMKKLSRFKALEGHDVVRIGEKRLTTTYFDTADRLLKANNISLRIRRAGRGGEQTVKAGGSFSLGMADRPEHTVVYGGQVPDISRFTDEMMRARLVDVLGASELLPTFTIKMARRLWRITNGNGDVVDFSIDNGEVSAGEQHAPVIEAEFELVSGDRRALFDIAKGVLKGLPFTFSTRTKSDLGFALVDGTLEPLGQPVFASAIDLNPDDSVESALQTMLRSCVAQISANLVAVRTGRDPEGPHQLRVGLRRLRSVLSVFSKVIAREQVTRIKEDARWLATEVGAVRDLDVMMEELVAPLSAEADMGGILDMLDAKRTEAHARLDAAVTDGRTGAFLIDLVAFTEGRGWLSSVDIGQSLRMVEPIETFAGDAVRRLKAKVARMGADPDGLSPDERHELRKKFKALRYTVDFFLPVLGKAVRKDLLPAVKAAQDVLGTLNDIHMAHVMLDGMHPETEDNGRTERAIGFCLGWHAARAKSIWEARKRLISLE
ncbi:CYTH and CHAD domain-containing protein [Oryzibacter oryziterrae]|uniref:CYTH and CHAD domain-containing protein n=1 Tax=Oryzibacter oryziterrae TaxID=2766474 RepID=UPI001F15E0C1|nr:CYTH and CHAD domain-containing protein [Oryzibacter oryziterrae]